MHIILDHGNLKFKHLIDDITIYFCSFWNFVSMNNIIRMCNPTVRFLKFTFNKKLLAKSEGFKEKHFPAYNRLIVFPAQGPLTYLCVIAVSCDFLLSFFLLRLVRDIYLIKQFSFSSPWDHSNMGPHTPQTLGKYQLAQHGQSMFYD